MNSSWLNSPVSEKNPSDYLALGIPSHSNCDIPAVMLSNQFRGCSSTKFFASNLTQFFTQSIDPWIPCEISFSCFFFRKVLLFKNFPFICFWFPFWKVFEEKEKEKLFPVVRDFLQCAKGEIKVSELINFFLRFPCLLLQILS